MHRGGLVKIFLIIAAVSLLMDWYVYAGLRTLTADWQSVRARQFVNYGYLIISIGVTLAFILGFGSFSSAKGMTPYHEWVLSVFLTFFFTKLFFILVLFLGDIVRFFYGIINRIGKPKAKVSEPFFPARRKFVSEI